MDRWALIDAYFRDETLVSQQIESYNQFVNETIPEIIEENQVIDPEVGDFRIELKGVHIEKPLATEIDGSIRRLYPMEARIRDRSYMASIYLDMVAIRRGVELQRARMRIGELPVMVKSDLCWLKGLSPKELVDLGEDPLDFGGYFIINGKEKILVALDEAAPNKVFVSRENRSNISAVATIYSTRGMYKGRTRVERRNDGIWIAHFPLAPRNLKWVVLLRALGFTDDQEILDAFLGEKEVLNDALLNLEASEIKTEEEAIDYIGKFVAPGQIKDYRLRRAQEVIDNYLLPHIGTSPEDRKAKGYFLIRMAERTSEAAYGLRPFDDKDHLANKRVELSGKLMETLFRFAFRALVKDIRFQVERALARRKKLRLNTVVRPNAFTEAIMYGMSTGTWPNRRTGVAQNLNRLNFIAPIYMARRVNSPLSKRRKNFEAREVHGTHFGRFCPIQTPEGVSAGLIKYLALTAKVTTATDPEKMDRLLKKLGVKPVIG